ncbi:MAG: bifunctional 3-(3-hydroxy-phenyl)propionate/3-hydroxycinnamic acid hydroxylase [Rhizobiaceae bacterium]
MDTHYDVAIVGYGPTGATLANLLGQLGVRVFVVDREDHIYDLPRAVHFDDEIMRIFQAAGIAEALLKQVRVNPGMRFVDANGKLLLDWPRPAGISAQGWNTSYRFHQPDLERILRESVSRMENVTALCGHRVSSITQGGDGVKLMVEKTAGGEPFKITAEYAVGCDGARSMMRSTIGTQMEDFGFREKWLVVDVELTRPRPDLGDHSIQHCGPSGSATYVRGPQNRRRWEIALKPEDEAADLSNADTIWRLIERWISPSDAVLERHAIYEFRSVVAEKWAHGRLFLAGDSAHQMPPFMGQGLCAGTRDAANLAWKLAACIKDGASTRLLESYVNERRPHVSQFVQMSMRLGGLINASKTQEALAAAFPQADGSAKLKSLYPPLGPGLGVGVGVDVDGQQQESPLSSQFLLQSGQKLDDHVGLRPVLLINDQSGRLRLPPFAGEVLFANEEPEVRAYLSQQQAAGLLIRPDRYVFSSAQTSADIPALVLAWNASLSS